MVVDIDNARVWVAAVERAYVAARGSVGGGSVGSSSSIGDSSAELAVVARAAIGAVASRFLAVGTPRSIGLIGDVNAQALSLAAHRVWFQPVDIRCHGGLLDGGRPVSLDEALAADIVCVHGPLEIAAHQLRRGTHVNALAVVTLPADLHADIFHERADLPALAAGLRDGRQLDEITVLIVDDGAIALLALTEL